MEDKYKTKTAQSSLTDFKLFIYKSLDILFPPKMTFSLIRILLRIAVHSRQKKKYATKSIH